MAKILDGKWLASLVRRDIQSRVEALKVVAKRPPGLGVILIGDNPASQTYVATKERIAAQCGFHTQDIRLPSAASFREVQDGIRRLNQDEKIDGILLQLPLPSGLDATLLLDEILPEKDADGLHPLNQGLSFRGGHGTRPCTPSGVLKLIDLAFAKVESGAEISFDEIKDADISGLRVVVIGRSILVGRPLAFMLLERNATVTIAHSRTKGLQDVVREADIVVAAVGVPKLVKADWVKSGAIVIDVGTNRLNTGELVGDVDYAEVLPIASAITPVPGGVGPMTVAMLMQNTFLSYVRKFKT